MAAWVLIGVAIVVAGGIVFLGVARATDQPSFCGSACHEMGPYHAAWAQGPHRDIACVQCHVGPGQPARLEHKITALQEVMAHFQNRTSFPLTSPIDVPNSRCTVCHTKVTVIETGFDHAAHATRATCAQCHTTAGHNVTTAALAQAGILNAAAVVPTTSADSSQAVIDRGAADLPGHVTVVCSRCHTMSKTRCSSCHTPQHKPRGECSACHQPGPKFVFTHPSAEADCASCHQRPKVHPAATQCTDCHEQVGRSWMHAHEANADCTTCHTPPAKHFSGTCATCHTQPGKTWAFAHPSGSADCESCHQRPANMPAGQCSTCHQNTGVNWTFAHPGISADCQSCHQRPANMPAGQCSTCHTQPGVSWAFAHPNIPGGQHTSKSFACTNCHPNGYTTHTCIKCHDSAAGG